jgi:membrane-associated phospholipid phosphatase
MTAGRRRHLHGRRAAVDRSVHRAIVSVRPSRADAALAKLSRAANHGKLWFGIAGVLALTGPASRRGAARGLISLGIASATANLVGKSLVGGSRPDITSVPFARRMLKTPTSGSFPSGHTASAVAFAAGVALEQPAAGAILAPVAFAVGYSRLHVGAHWFSDVLGGAIIGGGAAALTVVLTSSGWFRRTFAGPRGPAVDLREGTHSE